MPGELVPQDVTNIAIRASQNQWAPATRYAFAYALRRLLKRLRFSGAPEGLEHWVPKVPPPSARATTLSRESFNAMLAIAPAHLRLLLLLCHDAALRANTAIRLGDGNYNAEERMIVSRTKHGKIIAIPASVRLAQELARVPKGDAPFVARIAGRSLGYGALRRQLCELADKAEVKGFRLHDLRRTMAVSTYECTHDLRVVQSLLGHDNIAVTFQYLRKRVEAVNRETVEAVLAGPGVQP